MARWYTVNSVKYPSVTSIIDVISKGEGLLKWVGTKGWDEAQKVFKESGLKGQYVHEAVEAIVLKDSDKILDILKNHPEIEGYIKAAAKFLAEHPIDTSKKILHEYKVHSLRWGYGGKLDFSVVFLGSSNRVLLDWKTTNQIRSETRLQTIAYVNAHNEMFPKDPIIERMIVKLNSDGTYDEPTKYTRDQDVEDFNGFLGALEVFKWMNKSGYTEQYEENQ